MKMESNMMAVLLCKARNTITSYIKACDHSLSICSCYEKQLISDINEIIRGHYLILHNGMLECPYCKSSWYKIEDLQLTSFCKENKM
jgi:hypothetical protein